MKWIGMLLVIIPFILMGFKEVANYKQKMVFFKELEGLACFFSGELRFTCDEPLKILNRYVNGKGYKSINDCSLEQGLKEFLLFRVGAQIQDETVDEFVQGLGTTDLEGQLSHCTRFEHLFAEKLEEATKGYQLRGKLRQKLWLLAGVAGVLLLL